MWYKVDSARYSSGTEWRNASYAPQAKIFFFCSGTKEITFSIKTGCRPPRLVWTSPGQAGPGQTGIVSQNVGGTRHSKERRWYKAFQLERRWYKAFHLILRNDTCLPWTSLSRGDFSTTPVS